MVDGHNKIHLISSPNPIELNKTKRMKFGNSFLIGQVKQNGDADGGGFVTLKADKSEIAKSLRGAASQHYNRGSRIFTSSASFTIPVPKSKNQDEEYYSYLNTSTVSEFNPNFDSCRISMGNIGDPEFSDYMFLELNREHQFEQDCFVIGLVDGIDRDFTNSYIIGEQKIEGNWKTIASASQHHHQSKGNKIYANSFCMPVAKGVPFRVKSDKKAGEPNIKAMYITFNSEKYKLSNEYTFLDLNTTHKAGFDGFVVANMQAAEDGVTSTISIFSNNTEEFDLQQQGPLAVASIHSDSGHGKHIPMNSVMLPIANDNSYRINVHSHQNKRVDSLATWIRLVKK